MLDLQNNNVTDTENAKSDRRLQTNETDKHNTEISATKCLC